MTQTQAAPSHSHMGTWMAMIGAAGAILGGILLGVGNSQQSSAQRVREFGGRVGDAGVTMGYVGLGLLIFCAALFVGGLIVNGLKRS